MASEVTVLNRDGQWKIEVEAWKNNFLFYRSIGCQVTVYHREQTTNVWGSKVTDWVEKKADSIGIRNVYSGVGPTPGTGVREKICQNSSSCELKHSSGGTTLTIPVGGPTDVGGGAILDVDKVDSTVDVTIGREVLHAEVSASSAASDNSIW